jgi:hypothetical protein
LINARLSLTRANHAFKRSNISFTLSLCHSQTQRAKT